MQVIVIRHFGVPFWPTQNTRLIATGVTHHIVLLM